MTITEQGWRRTPLSLHVVEVLQHELRTPLTAVVGHAELLQDLELPPGARTSVDSIVRAAERLRRFTDVLTLPTFVATLAPSPCDLLALVRDLMSGRASLRRPDDPPLELTALAPTLVAPVDEVAVREALSALVDVAVDRATSRADHPVTVELLVEACGDAAVVEVRCPRPAKTPWPVGSQLQRFQQAAAELTAAGEEVLRLSLADSVANMHDGSLWVSADLDGAWITRLELPRGLRLAA